jgi:hypothetical protein
MYMYIPWLVSLGGTILVSKKPFLSPESVGKKPNNHLLTIDVQLNRLNRDLQSLTYHSSCVWSEVKVQGDHVMGACPGWYHACMRICICMVIMHVWTTIKPRPNNLEAPTCLSHCCSPLHCWLTQPV